MECGDLVKQLDMCLKHGVNLLNGRHFSFMSYCVDVMC